MSFAGRHDALITTNVVTQVIAEGNIAGIVWHNDHSAAMFMQIFDVASGDVTIGGTVPDMTLQAAANTTAEFDYHGAKFGTAFSYAITTTATGTTAAGQNWVTVVYI